MMFDDSRPTQNLLLALAFRYAQKKQCLPFDLPGRMTFAHTMDSSWQRWHASSCSSSKRKVPFIRADYLSCATPLHQYRQDRYSTKGGCTSVAGASPLVSPLSTAAGDAAICYSSGVDQQRKPWKRSFTLHRVGELSLERVGNSFSRAVAVGAYDDGVLPAAMREVSDAGAATMSSSSSRGMGEETRDKAFDWREGLGQVARVLAFSVSSQK